jgi:cell division septal protein FtsQ
MAKRIGANGRKKMTARHGKRGGSKGLAALGICAAIVLAGALALQGHADRYLSRIASELGGARLFPVKNVVVEGSTHLTGEELLKRAGIKLPLTLQQIKRDHLGALLAASPWIDKVSLARTWGGTLKLGISEREPVALAQAEKICFVDASGMFLPLDARSALELPLVSGLRDSTGADHVRRFTASGRERMNRFFAEAKKFDGALARRITQVQFGDNESTRILLEGSPTTVVINENETAGCLQRLMSMWKVVQTDSIPPARIDLAYRNLAFVTPEKAPSGGAAGTRKKGKS